MNYLQLIRIALGLLPEAIDAVKAIEAAVPQDGAGAKKLEAVQRIMEVAYNTGENVTVAFTTLWPVLSGMISAVVNLMNTTGVFKTAKLAAAPVNPADAPVTLGHAFDTGVKTQ